MKSLSVKLSIIVPVLNEASALADFLSSLQPLRQAGHQLIVVDGGSTDESFAIAEPLCNVTLSATPGRALQMNAGAKHASGDWLLFLHADTWLPEISSGWLQHIQIAQNNKTAVWGRFNVALSGQHGLFRVIESCINVRSKVTGIATGDQALFVHREVFEQEAGFASIPLMEDIELCKRLRRITAPLCINEPVRTSSRRWEQSGIVRTIVLMWELRLRYFLGASPAELVARYYPSRSPQPIAPVATCPSAKTGSQSS